MARPEGLASEASITGVRPGTLQQRLQRATTASVRDMLSKDRSRITLELLHVRAASAPAVMEVATPPCKVLHLSAAPRDIENIARLVASGHTVVVAAIRSGANLLQVKRVLEQCERFSAITGIEIGMDLTLSPP